jgi:hypothetical protein
MRCPDSVRLTQNAVRFKLPLSLEEAHKEQQNIIQKLRDKWWWRAWKNKITSRLSSKDLTVTLLHHLLALQRTTPLAREAHL